MEEQRAMQPDLPRPADRDRARAQGVLIGALVEAGWLGDYQTATLAVGAQLETLERTGFRIVPVG